MKLCFIFICLCFCYHMISCFTVKFSFMHFDPLHPHYSVPWLLLIPHLFPRSSPICFPLLLPLLPPLCLPLLLFLLTLFLLLLFSPWSREFILIIRWNTGAGLFTYAQVACSSPCHWRNIFLPPKILELAKDVNKKPSGTGGWLGR